MLRIQINLQKSGVQFWRPDSYHEYTDVNITSVIRRAEDCGLFCTLRTPNLVIYTHPAVYHVGKSFDLKRWKHIQDLYKDLNNNTS